MPATVSGVNEGAEWREEAKTVDISVGDVAVILNRPVEVGDSLLVELPFPVRIKGRGAEVKLVYTLVRRIAADEQGQQLVGLEFVEFPESPPS